MDALDPRSHRRLVNAEGYPLPIAAYKYPRIIPIVGVFEGQRISHHRWRTVHSINPLNNNRLIAVKLFVNNRIEYDRSAALRTGYNQRGQRTITGVRQELAPTRRFTSDGAPPVRFDFTVRDPRYPAMTVSYTGPVYLCDELIMRPGSADWNYKCYMPSCVHIAPTRAELKKHFPEVHPGVPWEWRRAILFQKNSLEDPHVLRQPYTRGGAEKWAIARIVYWEMYKLEREN